LGPGMLERGLTFASSRQNEISPLFSLYIVQDYSQQIRRLRLKRKCSVRKEETNN